MRMHSALRFGAHDVKHLFSDHPVSFVTYFLHNIKFTNYDLQTFLKVGKQEFLTVFKHN